MTYFQDIFMLALFDLLVFSQVIERLTGLSRLGKCIFREFNFTKIFVKNDFYLFLFQAVPFPKLWNPIKLEMISYLVESIG